MTTKTIAPGTPHCSQCARTDAEYVSNAYSGCCNEPVVWDCFGCTHNDDDSCGTTGCEAHDGECRDNWGEDRF